MDTGVSTEYVTALKEEADRYGQDVMSGKCESLEAYKFKVGYIQGLRRAEQLLHETIEHMLNLQDLDD